MGLNEYSWFWISGALAIIGVAFAVSLGGGGVSKEVEFAKAGLEECIKSKSTYSTMWVKDCVSYLQYVEEGIVNPNPNRGTNTKEF